MTDEEKRRRQRERCAAWRRRNPTYYQDRMKARGPEILAKRKEYRQRNAAAIAASKAAAWRKDVEASRERSRSKYRAAPESFRAASRRHYKRKAAEILARQKADRLADPHRFASYRRQRWSKVKDLPKTKLSNRLRARIHRLLGGGKSKNKTIWTTLGYSIDDLRLHIEKQFKPGMCWDNIGKWHIDHIVPVSSFSFESMDDPEFKACWALSNLRPLWKRDNIIKGAKRLTLV